MKLLRSFILFFILITSCSKSEGNTDDFFKSNIEDGSWVITSFTINDLQYAPDYLDYVLEFKLNGKVTAIKNSEVINGSWTIIYENASTSDSYKIAKLILNFNNSELFQKLNETWNYSINSIDEIDVVLPTKALRLAHN